MNNLSINFNAYNIGKSRVGYFYTWKFSSDFFCNIITYYQIIYINVHTFHINFPYLNRVNVLFYVPELNDNDIPFECVNRLS